MMKVDTFSPAGANAQPQPSGGEKVEKARKESTVSVEPEKAEMKVAPEEILDKIKGLTEGGLHSVRFEMNNEASKLVVKIFDDQEELLRQVPAEEVLDTSQRLSDYRGLLVDKQG